MPEYPLFLPKLDIVLDLVCHLEKEVARSLLCVAFELCADCSLESIAPFDAKKTIESENAEIVAIDRIVLNVASIVALHVISQTNQSNHTSPELVELVILVTERERTNDSAFIQANSDTTKWSPVFIAKIEVPNGIDRRNRRSRLLNGSGMRGHCCFP